MKYTVTMPSLGADMDQGKLMDWKIKIGDSVKKGQTIAVVETSKSAVEIESFRDGRVLELKAKIGEIIPVGGAIAFFEVKEEDKSFLISDRRPKISPAAHRLAVQEHLQISEIKGSGPEGQIELRDVHEKLSNGPTSTTRNLRSAIAKAMARSKKEIPHYYLKTQVHLDSLMEWIDRKNSVLPPDERLMLPVVLTKGIIRALQENPQMNGHFVDGGLEVKKSINMGIAIALKEGGVLVPAILEAQNLSLRDLNAAFVDLIIRARKGELKNRELTEGTFTITNVGDLGTDEVFGIIFPPQVALVGLGRVHKTAVVTDSQIREGLVIDVSLSADHRVTDGLSGARFLSHIESIYLDPDLLEEEYEYPGSEIAARTDFSRSSAGDRV